MSTTTYSFGDIVLIQFPFTDLIGSKKRPAIVVSGSNYNTSRPDVILMAVTSQLHASGTFGEVWLHEWHTAGLLKPSAAKPVFFTFEKALVLKHIGTLHPSDQFSVRSAITAVFQ